ncbi:cysteine proteinase [Apiospora arundinis]|uniref:ubiquitinyl hydrolase 1 n=1 Tax=Apiospora arundinis TaxID=335852 RepID=A0ABR2JA67_9PEZI
MNGSHLPAGQPMPGGVGGVPGGRGPVDMGHVPAAGNGPRRQRPQHYPSHQPSYYHQQHHNVHNPMYYSTPMNPYATSYYPQQMPHYYQNSHMPAAQYVPHHSAYPARSPPAMHQQYPPIVSSSMQHHPLPQAYSRPPPQQPSPAISTPPVYATALPPPPVPVPQAPSSTQSPQPAAQPPLTPSTPHTQASSTPPLPPQPEMEIARQPFKPPLPWLSRPDLPFPTKTAKSKRRRKILTTDASNVRLPTNHQGGNETSVEPTGSETATNPSAPETPAQSNTTSAISSAATMKSSDRSEAPSAQDRPSEVAQPASTTPSTTTQASSVTPTKVTKPLPRTAAPAVPVLPKATKAATKDPKGPSSDDRPDQAPAVSQAPPADASIVSSTDAPVEETQPAAAPAPIKPKLWTGLFANASAAAAAANPGSQVVPGTTISGAVENGEANGNSVAASGPFTKTNASSLAEAIALFRVGKGQKLAFLKPRGLINTGNMCYMNSILQVLIFCTPFYDFLDQVSQKAVHSFKSATPLVDAMIMFMREFHVIDSATSVEQLRMRLKNEELEQYGEPFAPEVVYDAIRKHKRFAEMQRGQQQDAEEFLGFLLESLREECKETMAQHSDSTAATAATPKAGSSPTDTTDSSDWLEVGTKQRAAITRSSGEPHDSLPTTQIFGGKLRSELKKTGCQDSIHYERFQPLQLDIGSPQVRNIIDALRNLTLPETLHDSDSKPGTTKTKQVFIETLPPVLILHLKRFQFDAQSGTGTTKIWKKVGYPLELELPKEVYSRQKRNAMVAEGKGFPKYRLIAAVYHHGKSASGGHYTVDVRRQDGQEWIRIDDTIIRRVRSEDVAEGGQEENAVKEASRPDQKRDTTSSATGNRFEGISGDSEAGDDEGWNQVATPASGGKKWSNVVNGNRAGAATATAPPPSKGKQVRDSIKDKVAYLLFYQRI